MIFHGRLDCCLRRKHLEVTGREEEGEHTLTSHRPALNVMIGETDIAASQRLLNGERFLFTKLSAWSFKLTSGGNREAMKAAPSHVTLAYKKTHFLFHHTKLNREGLPPKFETTNDNNNEPVQHPSTGSPRRCRQLWKQPDLRVKRRPSASRRERFPITPKRRRSGTLQRMRFNQRRCVLQILGVRKAPNPVVPNCLIQYFVRELNDPWGC